MIGLCTLGSQGTISIATIVVYRKERRRTRHSLFHEEDRVHEHTTFRS